MELNAAVPLAYDPATGLNLEYDAGKLQVVNGQLTLLTQLSTIGEVATNDVKFPAPYDTLAVTQAGQLGVSESFKESLAQNSFTVEAPLALAPDSNPSKLEHLAIELGKGLEVDSEGKLITNVSDAIKTLGALTDGGLASIGADEALSYGFSLLGDLTDSIPDEQVTIIRLKTGGEFTQKAGKLQLSSPGNQRVPYFGVFDGLSSNASFTFDETNDRLSVGHVEMTTTFNPASNEAPTQAYVAQYIQSGAGIDVAPEENNRRALNIRTDALLAVDGNNNIGVSPSAIVDGKTTRVVDGKISNGITFQPTFGLALENQNMAKLKPSVSGAITFTNENTIGECLTASNGVKRTDNDLSLDLEGSEYITVTGNKISTTLKEYEAGDNISIANGVISATVPEQETYTAGPGLTKVGNEFVNSLSITSGLGIIVAGSAETGYIISSESLKSTRTDDDDEETTTDDSTEQIYEATNSNPEVIEAAGVISSLVPLALTPLAGIGAIGAAPAALAGGLYGLLGGLAAVAGAASLFGTVFGYQKERRTKKNPDGSVQTDVNGNPVFDLDPNGNYQFNPPDGTNIAIVDDKTTRKSRLLFDSITLPTYNEQAMNYGMAWQFETDISRPWTVNTNAQGSYVLTSAYTPDQVALQSRLTTLESNSPITVSGGDLLKTGNAISLNPYQTTPVTINDLSFNLRRIVPYNISFADASPSTTTVSGAWGAGTYVCTQSVGGPNVGYKSWKSYFPEQQRTYLWLVGGYGSGVYLGSTKTTLPDASTISGEWAQIQLLVATVVSSFRFRYRNTGLGAPTSVCVLGSNDGTSWSTVVPISLLTWTSNNDQKWLSATNGTAFLYLRTIILATTNTGYANSEVFLEYFAPWTGLSLATSLSVSSNIVASTATFSGTLSAVSIPTSGEHLINKTFGNGTYSTISSLATTNTNVTNLTTRVSSAETTIGNIPSTYATVTSLGTTNTNVSSLTSRVSSAETTIGNVPSTYASISSLATTNTNVTNLNMRVSSAEITIGNVPSTYATISNLNTTNSNATALTSRVSSAESSITGLPATIYTNLKTDLLSSSGIVLTPNDTAKTVAISYDSSVISSQTYSDGTFATIGNLNTTNSNAIALTTRVSSAESSITSLPTIIYNNLKTDVLGSSGLLFTPNDAAKTLTLSYNSSVLSSRAYRDSTFATISNLSTTTGNVTSLTTRMSNAESSINALPTAIYNNLKADVFGSTGVLVSSNDAAKTLTISYDSTILVIKAYVDSKTSAGLSFTSPLSLTGSTVSLDSMQITSIGTLGSLTTSGSSTIGTKATIGQSYAQQIATTGSTYFSAVTTPWLNSTLNLVTAVNNSGTTADTPYPILNMIKPGQYNNSFDTTATFYLNRYSTTGTAANTKLLLGLANTAMVSGADPNTVVSRWRADGGVLVNSTADYFTTSSSSALYVAGGIRTGKLLFINLSANIASAPSYVASNLLDGGVL
ncbi:hypothetical protein HDU89_001146 [Geranomyces variabilis]|nr:hypothetical protein HDU89_001146 [Geranomyces variabilis]